MVNQYALRATTQFCLYTTSGKILRKNWKPDAEPFAAFVDGLQLSTTMLCNFDFLELQRESSGSFISGMGLIKAASAVT